MSYITVGKTDSDQIVISVLDIHKVNSTIFFSENDAQIIHKLLTALLDISDKEIKHDPNPYVNLSPLCPPIKDDVLFKKHNAPFTLGDIN